MAGVLACTAAVCLPFGLRTGFLDPDPKKVPPKVWTVWGDQAIGICEEVQLHGVDSVGVGTKPDLRACALRSIPCFPCLCSKP